MLKRFRQKSELIRTVHEVSDLYQHAPCGYHSLDKTGVIVRINSTELEWLGYTEEEVVGKMRFTDLITEASRLTFNRHYQSFMEKGYVHDLEFDVIRKDGSILPVMVSGTAVLDENGEFLYSRSTVFDMSRRRKLEKELEQHRNKLKELVDDKTTELRRINHELEEEIAERAAVEIALAESERHYRLLFLNNPQPMWIYDLETLAFLEVNDAAVAHYGYSHDEFLSMTLKDIRPREDIPLLLNDVATTYKPMNRAGTWRHLKKSGEVMLVEIISHSTSFNGRPARHVMVLDITEQKNSELELIKAKDQAQESDRLKSAFLANMSHEIRTPLNSILGFSELLNEPDSDEDDKKKFSRIIMQSGKQLLAIISDILDFSKIETGEMTISKSLISVPQILSDLHAEFKPIALEKKLEFNLLNPKAADCPSIYSDKYRVRQILSNLLSNAMKFTDHGSVETGFTASGNQMIIYVKDTGIGIPGEFHQTIFERFRQVQESKTRKQTGTGLGLAISKSLAEQLGGTLTVESEHGKGSIFYLTLPVGH